MLAQAFALLLGATFAFELASDMAPQATTRNDYDYIGSNITCSVAAYCARQQELYAATLADDLT